MRFASSSSPSCETAPSTLRASAVAWPTAMLCHVLALLGMRLPPYEVPIIPCFLSVCVTGPFQSCLEPVYAPWLCSPDQKPHLCRPYCPLYHQKLVAFPCAIHLRCQTQLQQPGEESSICNKRCRTLTSTGSGLIRSPERNLAMH